MLSLFEHGYTFLFVKLDKHIVAIPRLFGVERCVLGPREVFSGCDNVSQVSCHVRNIPLEFDGCHEERVDLFTEVSCCFRVGEDVFEEFAILGGGSLPSSLETHLVRSYPNN